MYSFYERYVLSYCSCNSNSLFKMQLYVTNDFIRNMQRNGFLVCLTVIFKENITYINYQYALQYCIKASHSISTFILTLENE